MVFKNKALKTTAAAIAIISMVGSGVVSGSYAYADSNLNGGSVAIEETLKDNTYGLDYKVVYIGKDGTDKSSSITPHIESVKFKIENGKKYIVLTYKERSHSLLKDFEFFVNGEAVESQNEGTAYTFEVEDFNSKIEASIALNINVDAHKDPMRFEIQPKFDGVYDTSYKVVYIGKDGTDKSSSITPHIESVKFKIENGKKYIVLTYKERSHSLLKDFEFFVNGEAVESQNEGTAYTFEVEDFNSKVEASIALNINVDAHKDPMRFEIIPAFDGEVVEEEQPETDTEQKPETDTEQKPETEETDKTIKDGTYKVSNTLEYVGTGDAAVGNDMARKAVSEKSTLVVEDGKLTATLNFKAGLYDFINNFRVKVDGKSVEVKVDKENRTITFDMPSVDSEVVVTIYVSAMGMDVSFKTIFDTTTLEYVDGTTSNGNTNNNTSNNGSTNNSTVTDTETEVESTVKKGKLYTIENTVSHSSQTGREMARKYLNSISKVEEIDGQYYVTLTFTGASFMQNHAIYVNGSKVSHEVVSKSGDSISLRFKVSDLSDSIKVGMYVIPMSRDIEFGVTLLEDTLTFVKDFELNEDGTLPQTGSAIDSSIIMGAGAMMMAAGLVGRRKRK